MPFRLPIFPLSVVLFPGTPLPLHIFEPRYRQMLADCLAGDRRFGITPAGQDDEMPEPGTVGCIAEVRVNQELPDGRSNIVVLGGERFVLTAAARRAGAVLRRRWCEPFEDEPGTEPSAESSARLREIVHRLLRRCSASSTTSSPRSRVSRRTRSISRSTSPPRSSAIPA